MKRSLVGIVAIVTLALAALAPAGAHAATSSARPATRVRPVIFVHGFVGSGAQFETQALRFTSNGYPASFIQTQEYDSTTIPATQNEVFTSLDQRIAAIQQSTGITQVDLVGHSLGTSLMQRYLSTPARAATVAHYVNIDGAPAATPPGGVPTLAIWARGHDALSIGGATNVHLPDQTHVQSATSAETFAAMYQFFNDRAPATTAVRRQFGHIELAGRAQIFPQNTGVQNGTLEIFQVQAQSGRRVHSQPDATFTLSGDGAWGPFTARAGAHYEFAIVRPGVQTHHLYFEPFERTDDWIHLLTSPPTGGITSLFTPSPTATDLVIVRYKELWGDQGANNDVLKVDGTNVVNAANSPINHNVNAIAVEDVNNDGITNLGAPNPTFFALPFFTGVDLAIPASTPPNQTVLFALTPRLGCGRAEHINIPNWASSTDAVSVQFHDYIDNCPRDQH
jgi:pimeloyl-ACP methyl ester carboxylesterase